MKIRTLGLLTILAGGLAFAACADETTSDDDDGTQTGTTTGTTSGTTTGSTTGSTTGTVTGGGTTTGTQTGVGGGGGTGGGAQGSGTCASPLAVGSLPFSDSDDTTNYADNYDSPCAEDPNDNEVFYMFTASQAGAYQVTLGTTTADLGIAIRTACTDPTTNTCCTANGGTGCSDTTISDCTCAIDDYCCSTDWDFVCVSIARASCDAACTFVTCADAEYAGDDEVAGFAAEVGETVYVIVEGYAAGEQGAYDLDIVYIGNESADCTDGQDTDNDGLPDCLDSDCTCTPGAGALGGACTTHTDCGTNAGNDPFCAPEAWGWTGGFCTEGCNLLADDCGAAGTCADQGYPDNIGLCLQLCPNGDGDCRTADGYTCQDRGVAAGNVCWPS